MHLTEVEPYAIGKERGNMYKRIFSIDTIPGTQFEGWTDGTDWNGWATPYFEYQQAKQLVSEYNKLSWGPRQKAWYDKGTDQFCFILDGEAEPESYSGEFIDINAERVKVYPIGTRVWIWEELTDS